MDDLDLSGLIRSVRKGANGRPADEKLWDVLGTKHPALADPWLLPVSPSDGSVLVFKVISCKPRRSTPKTLPKEGLHSNIVLSRMSRVHIP